MESWGESSFGGEGKESQEFQPGLINFKIFVRWEIGVQVGKSASSLYFEGDFKAQDIKLNYFTYN